MTQEVEEQQADVQPQEGSQEQVEANKPFLIENVDQFAELVLSWHTLAVAKAKHLLTVPDGMEIMIEGEDKFTLTGDALRAFKAGIHLSLDLLGTLPFSPVEQKEDVN